MHLRALFQFFARPVPAGAESSGPEASPEATASSFAALLAGTLSFAQPTAEAAASPVLPEHLTDTGDAPDQPQGQPPTPISEAMRLGGEAPPAFPTPDSLRAVLTEHRPPAHPEGPADRTGTPPEVPAAPLDVSTSHPVTPSLPDGAPADGTPPIFAGTPPPPLATEPATSRLEPGLQEPPRNPEPSAPRRLGEGRGEPARPAGQEGPDLQGPHSAAREAESPPRARSAMAAPDAIRTPGDSRPAAVAIDPNLPQPVAPGHTSPAEAEEGAAGLRVETRASGARPEVEPGDGVARRLRPAVPVQAAAAPESAAASSQGPPHRAAAGGAEAAGHPEPLSPPAPGDETGKALAPQATPVVRLARPEIRDVLDREIKIRRAVHARRAVPGVGEAVGFEKPAPELAPQTTIRPVPAERTTPEAEPRPSSPAPLPEAAAPEPEIPVSETDPAGASEAAEPAPDALLDPVLDAETPEVPALAQTDEPAEAAPSRARPAEAASPAARAVPAAWERVLAGARRLTTNAEGWNVVEMSLDEGEGTVTIQARREDGRVAVVVGFSDPDLRALTAAQADRLQQALQAEYETAVDLSLAQHDRGDSGGRHAEAGPARRAAAGPSGAAEAESRPTARSVLPGSARHEWVG